MRPDLTRRLEALEVGRGGQTEAADDPELELTRIIIEAYYSGQEPLLTPKQERMLRDTVQWFRDEGLYYLLQGDDP